MECTKCKMPFTNQVEDGLCEYCLASRDSLPIGEYEKAYYRFYKDEKFWVLELVLKNGSAQKVMMGNKEFIIDRCLKMNKELDEYNEYVNRERIME